MSPIPSLPVVHYAKPVRIPVEGDSQVCIFLTTVSIRFQDSPLLRIGVMVGEGTVRFLEERYDLAPMASRKGRISKRPSRFRCRLLL